MRSMKSRARSGAVAVLGLLLAAGAAGAQGPEHHHQHDLSAEELGAVHFPTSCDPAVQGRFDRATALLYSFGYEMAREAFLEVAAADPRCAMAHWGVAMTYYHPIWAPPTPEELAAGRAAAQRAAALPAGSDRERRYIAAIGAFYRDAETLDHRTRARAWAAGMEEVTRAHPEDREAQIFHALALLATAPPDDPTLAQQKRAGEILDRLAADMPRHPGIVHYLIHSFDYPQLAELALEAARVYAAIAPASPHAQHMPSHIFTRLGLWDESIRSNLDSEASANAIIAASHPGAVAFEALHSLDYLAYAYLQTGEEEKAREVVERAARAERFDVPNFAAGYALAAIPARWALERREWAEAARLAPPRVELPWEQFPYALASTHFARAIGAARSGDPAGARAALAELEGIEGGLAAAPPAGPYDWVGQVRAMRLAAAGWLAHAEGESEKGLAVLREAAQLQDRVGKHPVTPGEVLPARELLADLLAELERPSEAVVEYEAVLAAAPGRLNALRGAARAAQAAGEVEKSGAFEAQIAEALGRVPKAER